MTDNLPDYLIQGEQARLFPVLSNTSKEGRTTSIVLACMTKVDEFGSRLLSTIGQRVGVRSKIETYTEVVCKNSSVNSNDRPDVIIVLRTGSREWRALVETKVGTNDLNVDQIEKYRQLAKENNIDCVVTISKQKVRADQQKSKKQDQKSPYPLMQARHQPIPLEAKI